MNINDLLIADHQICYTDWGSLAEALVGTNITVSEISKKFNEHEVVMNLEFEGGICLCDCCEHWVQIEDIHDSGVCNGCDDI